MGKKQLIIFDFDETLTHAHTHDDPRFGAVPFKSHPRGRIWSIMFPNITVNQSTNGKYAEITTAIIQHYQDKGDEVSIASFHNGRAAESEAFEKAHPGVTNYETGPKFIREHLAASHPKLKLEGMMIRAFLPSSEEDADTYGKNRHIEYLVEEFNKKYPADAIDLGNPEDRKRVLLIDDSTINIELAKVKGYRTCAVTIPTDIDFIMSMGEAPAGFEHLEFLVKDSGISVKQLLEVREGILARKANESMINYLIGITTELERSSTHAKGTGESKERREDSSTERKRTSEGEAVLPSQASNGTTELIKEIERQKLELEAQIEQLRTEITKPSPIAATASSLPEISLSSSTSSASSSASSAAAITFSTGAKVATEVGTAIAITVAVDPVISASVPPTSTSSSTATI